MPLKARLKCVVRLGRLRERGHELRRPEADLLRDGIYELRVSLNHVHFRLLYSFSTSDGRDREADAKVVGPKTSEKKGDVTRRRGDSRASRQTVAVVVHGITKEDKVPDE